MRLIDADALKADYGMKDDCKDCEKEIQGYVRECHYNAVYTKMDFCEWIDSALTIDHIRKGKWIVPVPRGDVITYSRAYWECDQCHKAVYFGNEMNFCPNCGSYNGENDEV